MTQQHEPLTPSNVRDTIREILPGIELDQTPSLNGISFQAAIWRFQLRVSLVTRRLMSNPERPGQGRFEISYQFKPRDPAFNIRSGAIHTVGALRTHLVWFKGYLLGIVEAVERVLTQPPEPQPRDIFDS